jgi:hypothetical protein
MEPFQDRLTSTTTMIETPESRIQLIGHCGCFVMSDYYYNKIDSQS